MTSALDWRLDHPAVWAPLDTDARAPLIRHPAYPFEIAADPAQPQTLFTAVLPYLERVWPRLGLPRRWLDSLRAAPQSGAADMLNTENVVLLWHAGLDQSTQWPGSFLFARMHDADDPVPAQIDGRVAVLIAGLHWQSEGMTPAPLFGEQGLRVCVRLPAPGTTDLAAITGVTSTLPRWCEGPIQPASTSSIANLAVPANLALAYRALAEAFGVAQPRLTQLGVYVDKICPPGEKAYLELEIRGRVANREHDEDDVALELRAKVIERDGGFSVTRSSTHVLVSGGAPERARLIVQDPASRTGRAGAADVRPNRALRDTKRLADALPIAASSRSPTELRLENERVRVLRSRLVTADRIPGGEMIKAIHDGEDGVRFGADGVIDCALRTNSAAALNAFERADAIFRRLGAWGFAPDAYFRFVEPRLEVQYRASIVPGARRDGRTVNAQCRLIVLSGKLETNEYRRSQLELRFALGDLAVSPERAPLGIACDPRWGWHEAAHVLIAAATGELELRFAHSVGDALAAILCDPRSVLAAEGSARFATFPWVALPQRRHDRRAEDGWNWQRMRYRAAGFGAHASSGAGKPYWAEQVLSSTLFHLYRLLGGDATRGARPDLGERERASQYTTCLIAGAIGLLGPAQVVPCLDADGFVSSLMDADGLVETFVHDATHRTVGGAAYKVIRWAFERQGLYRDPVDAATDGAGEPEPVDIYIGTRRAMGYEPIADEDRYWAANAGNGIQVQRHAHGSTVRVQLGNRGTDRGETRVTVRLWAHRDGTSAQARWDPAAWTSSSGQWRDLGARTLTLAPATEQVATFEIGSETPLACLLASASAEADIPLIDPANARACSRGRERIRRLAALDNNLAIVDLS